MKKEPALTLTCTDALRLIDDHIDGELAAGQEAALAEHVQTCAECRNELESALLLREVLALGHEPVVLTEALEESTEIVMARIQEAESPHTVATGTNGGQQWLVGGLTLAASLLIFSALTWYNSRMMTGTELPPAASRLSTPVSPMMLAVSAETGTDTLARDEEEALLATGMLTLATPGLLSRLEVAAGSTPRVIAASARVTPPVPQPTRYRVPR